MNARKGLKKIGLRRYLIEGPMRAFIIERDAPYRFFVSPQLYGTMPHGFFAQAFKRLKDAREHAEKQAGL